MQLLGCGPQLLLQTAQMVLNFLGTRLRPRPVALCSLSSPEEHVLMDTWYQHCIAVR